jgi:Zn-dependent protease/predicted transcriptional regulator
VFGKQFPLFKLFGFQVKIELSWLIFAALIVWSLATNQFPSQVGGLPDATYWWLGVAGALGLFGSIVVHEVSHSLVARRYGLPIKGITLFIFGGVAEMDREPPSPQSEFRMALAGPISSALLALGFWLISRWGLSGLEAGSAGTAATALASYLASINGSLAAFNLIPAFPLDGGRVLRSILWGWRDDLRWATRLASRIGSTFGYLLVGLGVLGLFVGRFSGGLWLIVIGMFLNNAARSSYRQLAVREALEGEPVQRFMTSSPVTVPPTLSVSDLVEQYVYEYHFKTYPVVQGDQLMGCVSTRDIQAVPRDQWSTRTVGSLANQCSVDNTIAPAEDALEALSKMSRTRKSRLMVVDEDRLVGMIALKDLLSFLSLKIELER